ncbi:MAG: hypothetical protein ACLF0P_18200 [Thermoanaerobaculia bacterium]
MPDRPKSTRPPDWTDHGAFRAAFLERFEPEDRQVLQKAGSILAVQVISGDVHREPVLVSEFRAAIEDARMLRDYLEEIHASVQDELPTEAAEHLAREAAHWQRSASDLAHGMAASLQTATGEWPEDVS